MSLRFISMKGIFRHERNMQRNILLISELFLICHAAQPRANKDENAENANKKYGSINSPICRFYEYG